MDLSAIPTEELMKMRQAPQVDLSGMSTEQLMKMRGSDQPDPTGSFGENLLAGAGKAFADVGRGATQMVRQGLESGPAGAVTQAVTGNRSTVADLLRLPNQADIDEAKRIDAPLMNTGGGTVGNILGGAALFAPAALVPGANTVTGAAIGGAVMGALQPTASGESRGANMALGAGLGGATQGVAGKVASTLEKRAAAKAANASQEQAQNAGRDAVLEQSKASGYVIPPAQVNPSLVATTAESLAGKVSTEQAASKANQKVTDTLARQAIGMKPDAIMSKAALADAREVAAEPYRQISKLSPEAKSLLDEWKQANFDAKMQWNYFRKSGNPEAYTAAQAAGDAAEKALNGIEAEAAKVVNGPGAQQFVEGLKAARVKLAQIHTVESAMTGAGHIDARMLAKMGERLPLQGELKMIADFASNFPKAAGLPEKIGSAGVATLRSAMGAGVGTMISGPAGAIVGGTAGVAVPWTVRQMLLSGAGQSLMANPSYSTGAGSRAIAGALANPAVKAALPPASVGAALQWQQ